MSMATATATATVNSESDTEILEDIVRTTNVGHLLKKPTELVCPACQRKGLTIVEREAVTCVQRLVALINFCLCCNPIRWSGRHDLNHYCSNCGCYIGRYITLSWYKRQLFRMQHDDIVGANRWQRFHKIEKEQLNKNKQNHLAGQLTANQTDNVQPNA